MLGAISKAVSSAAKAVSNYSKNNSSNKSSSSSSKSSSSSGSSSQKQKQYEHLNNYINDAIRNNNKSQLSYANEQKRRLDNNESLQYTYKYDGRGLGYNNNYNTAGREYRYDPRTNTSSGNLKMANPNYDLMRDSNYNYTKGYADQVFTEMYNDLQKNNKFSGNYSPENNKQWLFSFQDDWIKNQLANGPYATEEAQKRAENAGINTTNLVPNRNLTMEEQISQQINNEIKRKADAINQELDRTLQSSQLAVNQNNQYLTDQLNSLRKEKTVADDQAINLSNRRGGFYSGGTDYMLGQNTQGYNQQQQALRQQIEMRNAEIYDRNRLLAEQAADQISQLQQQAPDLIRARINEELDRQRQFAMQEAGLTGMYNGAPTLQYQNMQFDQQQALAQQQAQSEQQQLANLWQASETFGYVHPELSKILGIPEGTQTLQAKQMLANMQLDQQKFALQQAKASAPKSSGSRSSSKTSSKSSSKSSKPMTKADSFNNAVVFWNDTLNQRRADGSLQGVSTQQLENEIMSNVDWVRSQGYDINEFKKALWYASTNGRYTSADQYNKFLKSMK